MPGQAALISLVASIPLSLGMPMLTNEANEQAKKDREATAKQADEVAEQAKPVKDKTKAKRSRQKEPVAV